MQLIPAEKVRQWQGRLVDVRGLDEFAAERLAQAECVPLDRLLSAASSWERSEPILVMCKSGMRSRQAAEQLAMAGFNRISMLEGGIDACKRAGVEVVRQRGRIPVIRQVLIGASLMLLAGLVLARLVHPWFIVIDWFVACGLLVAGLTGFCPMALMLAKMPWNRVDMPASPGASCCGTGNS